MNRSKIVTTVSLVTTIIAVIIGVVAFAITEFYPAFVVLLLLPLVPIISWIYAKKITGKSNGQRKNYYTRFTIINALTILVVLWMMFVIVHDRIFQDCC